MNKFDKLKVINNIQLKLKDCEYSINELEYDNYEQGEIEYLNLLEHDIKYVQELLLKYKNTQIVKLN